MSDFNLVKQWVAFCKAVQLYPISPSAFVLYNSILYYYNMAHFPVNGVRVPESLLAGMSGLAHGTFSKARVELANKRYIDYVKGKKGQAPLYVVHALYNDDDFRRLQDGSQAGSDCSFLEALDAITGGNRA